MNIILQDKVFIKELMERRNRTVYARITALTPDSKVKDEIIGYATEGSINIDGASAVRRSCNLTLITDNININDYNWVLNTRFRLEIGVKNNTALYPNVDIVWFPQGVYVITQFSMALGTNNYTISLSGQDKMCLLNGEVSGQITAETDFGKYDEVDENGNVTTKSLTLREIILALVHTYGLEPLENIVIELPDDSGYNLLTYRGQDPLYLLRSQDETEKVENFTFYGATLNDNKDATLKTLGNYWHPQGIKEEDQQYKGDTFTLGGRNYYVQKIEYGETAGYEETPLTYAGELKAAAGEAATNILDKIKNMLGEFEYFYDLEGTFRFQKKRTYLKTYMNDNSAIEAFTEGEYSYEFNDLSLFTSFNNNPNIKNLKNDFTVWGEYKTTTGASLPIHMRLVIDKKPTFYYSPWQKKTYSTTGEEAVDWREIIYQMAIDYQAHHIDSNYIELLEAANPDLVKNGRSGYEQYYTDILGFWRYLYEPDYNKRIKKYNRVAYNDENVTKYHYPWKLYEAPTVESKDFPYTSWYVNNENYKVLWTDSIDLTPGDTPIYYVSGIEIKCSDDENIGSLHRLYRYNQARKYYFKALGSEPLIEQPYYIYERDENGRRNINSSPVNIADSTTWGIDERLENLFLKKPGENDSNSVPLLIKIKPDQMTSTNFTGRHYRKGLYVQANNSSSPVEYTHIFYYLPAEDSSYEKLCDISDIDLSNKDNESQWKSIQEAFTKSSKIYFRSKDNKDIAYDSALMQAYVIGRYKMTYNENQQYALYYKTNNNMKLYAQYLMDKGIQVDDGAHSQVIDEVWLSYLTKSGHARRLLDNIVINRDDLYRKKEETGDFISAFEDNRLIKADTEIYIKDKNLIEVQPSEGEALAQYESYKTTKLNGSINAGVPEQKRVIEYFSPVSDYDLKTGWNKLIEASPQQLIFWFDFLDPDYYPQLAPYSVQNVGSRPMVKTEKIVTAIYYPKVPDVYFNDTNPLWEGSKEYFTISSQGQSAHDTIDSWLYNHTYVTESVSINSIPLYNLEPNTKVRISDQEHGIEGDYIIDKMTIPLAYNGTMSITATKAPETF